MIGSSARHPDRVVQRRGAVVLAAVLALCFVTARLADAPMAANVAPMAAIQAAVDGAGEAREVVRMAAMLCPDDGLGAQAGGIPQPMPAATWPVIAVVLFAATWFSGGLPARQARAPGPTRQALLQRFQL